MARYYVVNFTKTIWVKADDERDFKDLPHHEQMRIAEDAIHEINCGDAPMTIGDADWDNVDNIEQGDDD